MGCFSNLQTYGKHENNIWPNIIAQEAKKTHETKFQFSGLPNFGYQDSHISKGAGRRIIQMFWKPNEKTFPIQALCAPGMMKVALQGDATHWGHT